MLQQFAITVTRFKYKNSRLGQEYPVAINLGIFNSKVNNKGQGDGRLIAF